MTSGTLPSIYLDNGATTPVDPLVVQAMIPWLHDHFGNPASRSHAWGWEADKAVSAARHQVAALIGADPREIVWTSGATESDNLALQGVARHHRGRGRHIVTVKTEHPAVLDTLRELEGEGFQVSRLDVRSDGLLDLDTFAAALQADTILASVMLVNNEIGVIQDIDAIGRICRSRGVLLHVDAAQATGKLAIDLGTLPVDLMSLASHKTYGPKGIGALFVRRQPRVHLTALLHGGGHEHGLRSGTLPTHQIVGMGEAFHLAAQLMESENARVRRLQRCLLDGLLELPGAFLNGHATLRVPHNVNVGFEGVNGESLMLGVRELAVSSGSACASGRQEPSHVLRALGRSDEQAHASLRVTIGRFNTEAEIERAVGLIRAQLLHQHAQRVDRVG